MITTKKYYETNRLEAKSFINSRGQITVHVYAFTPSGQVKHRLTLAELRDAVAKELISHPDLPTFLERTERSKNAKRTPVSDNRESPGLNNQNLKGPALYNYLQSKMFTTERYDGGLRKRW